jgi:hypothetical protein
MDQSQLSRDSHTGLHHIPLLLRGIPHHTYQQRNMDASTRDHITSRRMLTCRPHEIKIDQQYSSEIKVKGARDHTPHSELHQCKTKSLLLLSILRYISLSHTHRVSFCLTLLHALPHLILLYVTLCKPFHFGG